ncbi:MAG: succinate CoA transferase [Planctomycetota bacterium]
MSDFTRLTAEEAAELIKPSARIGFSGFTPAGAAKAVPRALAVRATELAKRGSPMRLSILTGASTGAAIDDALAQAGAIAWRAPYQGSRLLRDGINRGEIDFVDMHLSHVPQMVDSGFLGELDFAVVEAVGVEGDGRVYLSSSVGASPSFLRNAKQVIVEVNRRQSHRLPEMHDIAIPSGPPQRSLGIESVTQKIGVPYAAVDPKKIVGVVETDEPDDVSPFSPPDTASQKIADHVVRFLLEERAAGRIPASWVPLQAGVGNVANAVMAGLGAAEDVPPFEMYTEVFQDSLVDLMESGRLVGASSTALTLSPGQMGRVYDAMDFFAPRIVLRPQEVSNQPGVVRRLGLISINTILEMDLVGCANSTHVCGTRLMNGVGGSGDFTRNAYLSILVAPSVAKGGKISAVVPMVSHVDHNEHSVQVLVTDQGLADLRGLAPRERAERIIDKCAHPSYRGYLRNYLRSCPPGHVRQDLWRCFELHQRLIKEGTMGPADA